MKNNEIGVRGKGRQGAYYGKVRNTVKERERDNGPSNHSQS